MAVTLNSQRVPEPKWNALAASLVVHAVAHVFILLPTSLYPSALASVLYETEQRVGVQFVHVLAAWLSMLLTIWVGTRLAVPLAYHANHKWSKGSWRSFTLQAVCWFGACSLLLVMALAAFLLIALASPQCYRYGDSRFVCTETGMAIASWAMYATIAGTVVGVSTWAYLYRRAVRHFDRREP